MTVADHSGKRPTAVLFDVDGTLVDSRPAIVAAYRAAFATVLGIEHPRTEEDVVALLAPRVQEVCATIGGERADECVRAYRQAYLALDDDLVKPLPGAVDLLEGLDGRGIAIGLVTNKGRERIGPDLRRAGLQGIPLVALVCAEDTVDRKPHPAPVLEGLRTGGCDPERTLYVGDGPQDVLAAAAAGVRSVGASYGYYGPDRLAACAPDLLIDRPEDLLRALDTGVFA